MSAEHNFWILASSRCPATLATARIDDLCVLTAKYVFGEERDRSTGVTLKRGPVSAWLAVEDVVVL
jgi:hypothetical protein